MTAVKAFLLALAACKSGAKPKPVAVIDAAPPVDATPAWPELADFPSAEPTAAVDLPVAPAVPLTSVVGPVVVGDVAVIGSSQLGFAAIDYRAGRLVWRRVTGSHLAPPVVHGDGVLLVGECEHAAIPPTDDVIVGCWWVVAPGGADLAAGRFAGAETDVRAFVAARGDSALAPIDDDHLVWSRGDAAVALDLRTERATAVPVPAPPRAIARHKGRQWRIAIEPPDDALIARDAKGGELWRVPTRFVAVVGILPGQSYEVPMVRVVNLRGASGHGFVDVVDIDATGSTRGQAGAVVPGLAVLAHAFVPPGDTALAIRLDDSLERDYIAAHDSRGNLAWVWPLPRRPRADPVGLAIAEDGAVIVFHDGDRLTVLPRVSRIATP